MNNMQNGDNTRWDVIIIGGGAAGLSAATTLGRSLRKVLILDAASPRNQVAEGVHNFLSRDGIAPQELMKISREQLQAYPSVTYNQAKVSGVSGVNGAFEVIEETTGLTHRASKILLATGVRDELPPIKGFQELWGHGVYSCPYCHGWEVRNMPLAVYSQGEEALEYAPLIRNWSRDVVLLTNGSANIDEAGLERLANIGITIREEKIERIAGNETGLECVVFEDGTSLECKALFVRSTQRQHSDFAVQLGCEIEVMVGIPLVKHTPLGETTVPGVYVAGDAGNLLQQVIQAAASGSVAASFINRVLVLENQFGAA